KMAENPRPACSSSHPMDANWSASRAAKGRRTVITLRHITARKRPAIVPEVVKGASMKKTAIIALGSALTLAACSGAQDKGDGETSQAAATSGWDATDAC